MTQKVDTDKNIFLGMELAEQSWDSRLRFCISLIYLSLYLSILSLPYTSSIIVISVFHFLKFY